MGEHLSKAARSASSISCGACEHGTVYITFHDENGEVFAYAPLPVLMAVEFSTDLTGEVERAVELVASGEVTPAPEVH